MSSKKFVLYKFFKILFNFSLLKSSSKLISPNIIMVSLEILSFPIMLIFSIFSALTDLNKNNKSN